MRWDRSKRFGVLVGLLLLAGLGATLAEESFVHTDDGCPVETHCLACRLAVGTAAVMAPVLAGLLPGLETAGPVASRADALPRPAEIRQSPSRGPPTA